MDLHVPEGPVRSLKDFLLHIVIVTIGILIALGLEQAVEAHHRAVLVHAALDGFEKELTADETQLDEVIGAMPKLRAQIEAELANLNAAAPGPFQYTGVYYNPISTASWDTAVATQALSDLPLEQAHLYAEAFNWLRLFGDVERQGMSHWESTGAFGGDVKAMTPDERRTLIERLRHYKNFTQTVELIGNGAKAACDRALKKDKPSHA